MVSAVNKRARNKGRVWRPVVGGVAAFTALAFGLQPGSAMADTAPVSPTEPKTVSSDALPTMQIDGVAWTQVVVGNTVFVGGNFQTARPSGAAPGVNTTSQPYLLAYDIRTGEMLNSFRPTLNGQVLGLAASEDGSRIYAVGDFTSVNGSNKYRIVALNTSDGSVIQSFSPGFNARVRAIAVNGDTIYVGGIFSQVKTFTRTRLAALRASDGAVLDWAPTASGGGNQVTALAMSSDKSKVIIGGSYTDLNGTKQLGLGAVDATTGVKVPWTSGNIITNSGTRAAITSLTNVNGAVYGTGYVFGNGENGNPKGNLEAVFSAEPDSGDMRWMADCHGDHYSAWASRGAAYAVGHAHQCQAVGGFPQTTPWTFHHALAFSEAAMGVNKRNTDSGYFNWEGTPSPKPLNWYPYFIAGTFTGQDQAAWSVTGNNDYVVLAGEFVRVNGKLQQGLTRFAQTELAPNAMGPELSGGDYLPQLQSPAAGIVKGRIQANWDRDNENLTYNVYRQGTATPIFTTQASSTFYNRPWISFTDTTNIEAGQTYRYRVQVVDPHGNSVTGNWTDVVASSTAMSGYGLRVLNDGPSVYYRLNEASGSVVNDAWGANNGTLAGSATRGATGAIVGDDDKAYTFAGGGNASFVRTPTAQAGTNSFAVEAWFKTTTNQGGKIVGFGNSATGLSSSYDRHVYMQNNGRLTFGVYPGSVKTVTSAKSYNDGNYHHVVAQLSSAGMELYVDGERVAVDPSTTTAQAYNGYWRIGGDQLNSWTNRPTNNYFAGTIDDVAIYDQALTENQVLWHWGLSGNGAPPPNELPTAAFSATPGVRTASFDASTSTDSDGTIVSYEWDFGDGSTGTGVTTSHDYAVGGTYEVKLKVTDNLGGVKELTQSVIVADPPPNQAPNADFSAVGGELTAAFDATAAADADGTIVSYEWDFGDGSTGTGKTTTHDYAEAGDYTVKLTVTDDDGATAELTKTVTVSPASSSIALDDFARDLATGWGVATKGGNWTNTGALSSFRVADGAGYMVVPAGQTRTQSLDGVAVTKADTTVDVTADRPAVGSTFVSVIGRKVSNNTDYRVKLRFFANGDVNANLVRVVNGTETSLGGGKINGLVLNNGDTLRVRVQVDGTGTTGLKTKVWKASDAEPGAWTVQANDTTAALQQAGGIALQTYVGGTVTNTPYQVKFDNLNVSTNGAPAVNQAPVAAFTALGGELSGHFDATASSDSDGSIAAYEWNFGDGQTGTGVTANHSYAAAGTYDVTLRVTDDKGATHELTKQVVVSDVIAALAADKFEVAQPTGWGTAEKGGAWTVTGAAANYAVAGGQASTTLTAGATRTASLNSLSETSADTTVDMTLDRPAVGSSYVSVVGRKIGNNDYRVKMRFFENGDVNAHLVRVVNGTETAIAGGRVTGLVFNNGDTLRVRIQVDGTGTTALKAKIWKALDVEPGTWTVQANDSTAALQAAGGVGIQVYASGSLANVPYVVKFDNLNVVPVAG